MASRAVHHIALRCADVETTASFYRDICGLELGQTQRDERGVRSIWLRAADVVVMCERVDPGEVSHVSSGSMNLLAFAVATEEWPDVEARLADRDVAIEGRTDFTLYLRDPDGRRVGLSSYPVARL